MIQLGTFIQLTCGWINIIGLIIAFSLSSLGKCQLQNLNITFYPPPLLLLLTTSIWMQSGKIMYSGILGQRWDFEGGLEVCFVLWLGRYHNVLGTFV